MRSNEQLKKFNWSITSREKLGSELFTVAEPYVVKSKSKKIHLCCFTQRSYN
jgi:hypothetical protein